MAIKLNKKVKVPAKATTPVGNVDIDDVEINLCVIVHVNSVTAKQGSGKFVALFSGDVSDVKSYEFKCNDSMSHVKQAYNHLLGLEEFQGAIRVYDKPLI